MNQPIKNSQPTVLTKKEIAKLSAKEKTDYFLKGYLANMNTQAKNSQPEQLSQPSTEDLQRTAERKAAIAKMSPEETADYFLKGILANLNRPPLKKSKRAR